MNEAAQAFGVRKKQLLTDAKALCPMMKALDYDPDGDAQRLRWLALWSIRYSPWVTPDGNDGILMDATGCAHLLGGEDAFVKDIQKRLFNFGFVTQVSMADTIGAAWALSHFSKNAKDIIQKDKAIDLLSKLPIAALRIDDDTVKRLKKVGLKTIGALINKPRASMTARYGKHLTNRLDQLLGNMPESLSPVTEPPEYSTRKQFLEPILMLEQISLSLDELTNSLSGMLKSAALGARKFLLFLHRVDGDVKSIEVRTSLLTDDADHISRLLNEKLSDLIEDYDAGFGIEQITLGAYFTEIITHHQKKLDGKKENGSVADFQALIDRYGNRLGFGNVSTFLPQESHIPERSEKLTPVSEDNKKTKNWSDFLEKLQGGDYMGRPILLLPRPEPITAIAEVPDGPPVHFEWRRLKYRIIRAEGPERLAPEWWKSIQVANEATRDYFRVEDADGGRFWLFRQGVYEYNETPKWFMHGFFA